MSGVADERLGMKYEHSVNVEDAAKFADWIKTRGGVAIWNSVNMSNPGASWSTPATVADKTTPYPKPTWEADDTPVIVTDPEKIEVYKGTEAERFRVGVEKGSGLTINVTSGGSRKIRESVAKAGEGAYYQFDYGTQEAVIFKTETLGSLKDWMEKQ